MGQLTPRARVQKALRGEAVDRIPLTAYWLMLPRGADERRLRAQGLTIVERVPLYSVQAEDCRLVGCEYSEGGRDYLRREIRTSKGTVYSLFRREGEYRTSWWQTEYYVKNDNDYRVLEYYFQRIRYLPDYERFLRVRRHYGEDGYSVGNTEYTPMNMLIYRILGLERFAVDLAERPDRVLSLLELLRDRQRQMYEVCARSPAELVLYGGNIHQDVVGLERFCRYYLPCLNEFADRLHENGKLAGCHFDARMRSLLGSIGSSRLDVIEALTPPPTGDVSVSEAREACRGKSLWVNFPSTLHVAPDTTIEAATRQILMEAAPGDRLLLGITEDVPEEHRPRSLLAISRTLRKHGRFPLDGKALLENRGDSS
jgi:hypothetical protein